MKRKIACQVNSFHRWKKKILFFVIFYLTIGRESNKKKGKKLRRTIQELAREYFIINVESFILQYPLIVSIYKRWLKLNEFPNVKVPISCCRLSFFSRFFSSIQHTISIRYSTWSKRMCGYVTPRMKWLCFCFFLAFCCLVGYFSFHLMSHKRLFHIHRSKKILFRRTCYR